MTAIKHLDRRPEISHKERMRARQLARKPGFLPVANKKINAAVAAAQVVIVAANKGAIEAAKEEGKPLPSELSDAAANRQAWDVVRKTLPSLPVGVKVRHA